MKGKVLSFKKKKKSSFIIISIIAFVLVAILLYILLGKPFLGFKRGRYGDVIDIDSTASYATAKYTGGVAVFGRDGIRGISNTGRVVWTNDFSASYPILASSGDYLLASDLAGQKLVLLKDGKEKHTATCDGNVITCSVNKKGYYAVVTTERGYKDKVSVYNKKGENIFTWHSAKNNVLSCAVSENGKYLAISLLNSEDYKEISNVMIFKIDGDDIVTAEGTENNLVSNVIFYGNRVLAIGDRESIYYSYKGEIKKTIDYKGRSLEEFYCDTDGILAMGFNKTDEEDYAGGSLVEIYDKGGKMIGSASTDSEISFLDTFGRYVLVNTEEGVCVINSGGRVVSRSELSVGAYEAFLCGSRNKLFLMSSTEAGMYIH